MGTLSLRIRIPAVVLLLLAFSASPRAQAPAPAPTKPWPIRVVIVATFDGEFKLWAEREHLSEAVVLPGVVEPVHTNADHTVLGMVSGTTLVNAAASMMALGLDPRFDLTHAYILINGIAGIDPQIGSIGSAVWAGFVVNDVAREIDPREAPPDWPYGIFPSGAARPAPDAALNPNWTRSNLYTLNPKLAAWAYAQTKDLDLGDDPTVAAFRAGFTNYPPARRPPFVLRGDTLASDYYWHGRIMTQYARDWVRLYTGGKGVFATSEMEDAGFMNAIERLDAIHRVDANRVMDLRTASNYTEQRPGHTAVESVTAPYIGSHLAFESAWLCGSTVVHAILANWDNMDDHVPGD